MDAALILGQWHTLQKEWYHLKYSFFVYDLFAPQAFAPLGAVFGGGIAGWAADGLGRKPALVMSFIPNLIGWLMLAVAQFWDSSTGFKCLVLIGRFFTGFAMGWAMLCSPVSL